MTKMLAMHIKIPGIPRQMNLKLGVQSLFKYSNICHKLSIVMFYVLQVKVALARQKHPKSL